MATRSEAPQRETPARPVSIAVAGSVALAASVGIARFVYTPILSPMSAALGLSHAAEGFIASANYAGYLVGALVAATAALRGSRRSWLLAALAVSALSTAAMGLASSIPAFLGLRFVAGVASAFGLILASALVLDRLAQLNRPALTALHFTGVGIGITLSTIVVSWLMAHEFGWRALWVGSGALAFLAVGVVAVLLPDHRVVALPRRGAHHDRRRGPLIVAYGLFGFGYVITATFLVAIVRGSVHLRPLDAAVWIVVGASAGPSVAMWAAFARRVGYSRAFAGACLLEAVGVVLSGVWTTISGILLGAALLGGTFMGLTALGLMRGRELAPEDPRRMLAAMTAAFGIGQIIGPAFAGLAYDTTGSFVMPSLVAAAALVTAGSLMSFHGQR